VQDAEGRTAVAIANATSPAIAAAFVTCMLQSIAMSDAPAIHAMAEGTLLGFANLYI
jgi:hypothetical protein